MKIKILPEDTLASKQIRKRDKCCQRCGSQVRFNQEGEPISHEASHFITRGNWAVRYDPENIDTLCFPCHKMWGGDLREEYKEFKIKQLGKSGLKKLYERSNQRVSKLKARAWAKLYWGRKNQ